MSSSLLPDRHPVRDFFVLENMFDATLRSDIGSMEHPFFSLSTRPDKRSLRYEHNGLFVEILPTEGKGVATIHDKDILIYCISNLVHRKNRKEPIGPTVRITVHDLLVVTNRDPGGASYDRLEEALDRLAGTRIKTNIKTGDGANISNFGLIDSFFYPRKKVTGGRLDYLEITLSKWLYDAIESNAVLSISKDYFFIRKPIHRRIYEIACKHCGDQPSWKISVPLLKKKCRSFQADKHFAVCLRELVEEQVLPDLVVSLAPGMVIFAKKNAGAVATSAKYAPAPPLALPAQGSVATPVPSVASYGEVIASLEQVIDQPRAIVVSADALEKARVWAPRWDIYFLEKRYIEWAKGLPDAAKNEDARFITWVKNWTKCKPPA